LTFSWEIINLSVQGCDASLLIKSTPSNAAEKDAGANLTVRGFDIIDAAKAAVEALAGCQGKVSCADIIALATRDAVALVHTLTDSVILLLACCQSTCTF
jgi:hypothetical protein